MILIFDVLFGTNRFNLKKKTLKIKQEPTFHDKVLPLFVQILFTDI